MTRPRTAPDRELFGIIGKVPNASKVQREWNLFFKEKGMDAFMDKYPTTEENLPERFSEMFHFDRRIYLVGHELGEAVNSLVDELDESAKTKGKVNLVFNIGGVLKGAYTEDYKYVEKVFALLPSEEEAA